MPLRVGKEIQEVLRSAARPALNSATASSGVTRRLPLRCLCITAHDHFSQFGIDENRSPSPLFDPGFYLTQSPDVAAAVAAGHFSAVQHFLLYGQREARAISPFIDLGKYLNANHTDTARFHPTGRHDALRSAFGARSTGHGIAALVPG